MKPKMELKSIIVLLTALTFLSFSNPVHLSTYTIAQRVQEFGTYMYSMLFTTPNLTCTTAGELSVNGSNITITGYRLKNSGSGPADVSYIGYYLSTDTNFTTDDYYIGQDYVDALNPGFSSTENFSVNLANFSNIPDGTYYVGVVIDHRNSIVESNENDNNNCYWDNPTVVIGGKPNLSCDFGGEVVLSNDTEVRVTWIKVKNTGVAAAGASTLCYYLSTDQNFTSDDHLVGTSDVPSLIPGEFVMVDPFEVDVATLGVPPGQYYLGFVIDCENDVMESNEEDNNDCGFDDIIIIPGEVGEPNLACLNRGELTIDENNGTLNISYSKVMSNGTTDAGASVLGVYLSPDQTFTTSDVLLASQNIPAIASGDMHMITPIDIDYASLNLAAGTYYIGLVIDHTNLVTEGNEADNATCSFDNAVVIPDPQIDQPNLTCDFRGELIINNEAQTFYTSWNKILNTGAATAGTSVLGIYLSTDEFFTTNDLLLATAAIPALEAGQSFMVTDAINVDFGALDLAPGTYYVGLIVDYTNLVAETSEADNIGCSWNEPRIFIPAEINEPDLICGFRGELIVDNTAQTLYTSWNKVMNNGTATADASVLGIYLSTDEVFTTNDLLLAEENIPALAPGDFYMVTDAINIDFGALNLAAGTYYVGLVIDHTGLVTESDEDNNNACSWNEPRIFISAEINEPNLTCDFRGELIVDNNAGTLYTSWNAILNNGSAAAPASVVGVYLSLDEVFTNNDLLIAEINIPAIPAGGTHLVTNPTNVNFDDFNLATATYYVGLIVDHTNVVSESDENDNNTCSWNQPRVYIAPDLPNDLPNLLCKDRGELTVDGTQVTIQYAKVQNNGTTFSMPTNVGFYVSADQNFTPSDYFIGSTNVGQLYPSQFEMLNTFTADLADFNIPPGNYFIGFIIDYNSEIEEIDENDNNTCGWATLATLPNNEPDLTCMSRGELIIDNAAETLYIGWTKVQNNGTAVAGPSTVGFYISSDQNFTTSDVLIATADLGSIAPGDFAMITSDINVDFGALNLAPGTYYVGVIVDHTNAVAESDETNNNNCSWNEPRIYITSPINDPDLACYDRGYLSITGTNVSIANLKVANTGSGSSAATTVGIYLSTDQNFTTTDIFIGNITLSALSSGQIHTVSFNTDIAALNLPVGTYYVGVIVDNGNLVVETNEANNNTCSWDNPQVVIEGNLPNLTCDFGGELTLSSGPHVRVTWVKVKNSGTAVAAASVLGFYLSTDQFFTPNDYFIGSVNIPALAPGEAVMAPPFDVDVTGVPAGTYYVGFIIDAGFDVIESNENDNNDCSFDETVTITGGLPDIICVDPGRLVVGDNGQNVVEDNSIDITVTNVIVGNEGEAPSTSCSVGFYLSRDDVFGDAGDIFIGSETIEGIEVGETVTIDEFEGEISEDVVEQLEDGTYTIGLFLDHQFDVEEEDEGNNDDCSYDDPIVIDNTPLGANLICYDDGEININGTNVSISWAKIRNLGDVASAATTVSYYASVDMNFTSNDYLLGTVNLPAIQVDQVHMLNTFNANLASLGIPAGNYFIGFVINAPNGNYVVEPEATQGCYWDAIANVPAAQSNLTCMTRGELAANGSVLDITWVKIQNNGGGVAAGSHLGFYLSTDLNFTTSDIYMGEVYVPAIQPGQSVMAPDFEIDLTSLGLSAGTYYIGMIIDHRNVVAETNEYDNNDCYWTTPKVVVNSSKPNLTCMDDGELTVNGSQINVSWMKVQNNGNGSASGFFVGYYLSSDQYFTTNDYYLGSTYVSALPSGSSTTLNPFSADIAALNIPPGTYYIGTVIDYQNHVNESNENDNNDCYWATTATISNALPDLTCMSQGEVSISGDNVQIGWVKVLNAGNAAAGASRVGFYLSTDQNFTATDIYLGNVALSALAAGQNVTLAIRNFNIASLGLAPGTYYIGFIIDDQSQVQESNEYNNNDCYFTNPTIQIPDNQTQPDLTVSCGNMSVTGSTLHLNNIIVTNIGNGPAGTSHVGYYLSLDTNFSTADLYLGEDFVNALGAGQSSVESISINISSLNLPAGTYYVGAIVDHQNEVAESNEVENHCCFYTRIQITGNTGGGNGNQKPDLRCKNTGQLAINGSQMTVIGSQVQNNGPQAAGASLVGYYLSTDNTFTTSDYFLGSSAVGVLNSGQIATVAFNGTIPTTIPTGTYYVGMIIDYTNVVVERDEDDNTCYWNGTIQITNSTNSDECACTDYFSDFCEDFDSYYLGALGPQSTCWTTWSGQEGGAQDGAVRASASNNYLKVKATQVDGGAQDVILQLGDRTSGKYILNFKMYLFGGDKAYYNLLHEFAPGTSNAEYAYEVFFEGNGRGYVRIGGVTQTFSYNMNAWNNISQEIDIDNNRVRLLIAGQPVASWRFTQTASGDNGQNKLAAMNFYPVDHRYEFYIDAINFQKVTSFVETEEIESRNDAPAPIRDMATTATADFDFNHYPNPTSSELFVAFELEEASDATVELINAIGQVVRTQTYSDVQNFNEVVNVSEFAAGIYYVRVKTADKQLTKQVVIIK